MSPDDMLALAEHDLHMATWCRQQEAAKPGGLLAVACLDAGFRYNESARYWREKAKENE